MFLQPSKISLVHVWQQTQMLKNILEMGFHNEASQFITQHGSDAVKPRRFGPELHIFIKEKTKMNWSKMGHFHLQYERFFGFVVHRNRNFGTSLALSHVSALKKNPAYSAIYSL